MTHYFWDSSVLVKRYLVETGAQWVRSVIAPGAGNISTIAQITPAEVVSAIVRKQRASIISQRKAHVLRLFMDRHVRRDYLRIDLTQAIVKNAENLLEKHPLRAYDAIQLASALENSARLAAAGISRMIFVSADMRLLSVANSEGLLTDDPNLHP